MRYFTWGIPYSLVAIIIYLYSHTSLGCSTPANRPYPWGRQRLAIDFEGKACLLARAPCKATLRRD